MRRLSPFIEIPTNRPKGMVLQMIPVRINSISVQHGDKIVGNDVYIEHFKQREKDVEHFLVDIIGRDKRYMFDKESDNSLTISEKAAKDALQKAGLTGADMDMILFSSQLPEYVAPPVSIYLHHLLGGKETCICYDMNANCSGMTICYEQTIKYMSASPNIRRALIVGCDYINMTLNPENENFYGHYGDAACAVVLEKADGGGMLDSVYGMNSDQYNIAMVPGCGFSNVFKAKHPSEIQLRHNPMDIDVPGTGEKAIRTLLERNGLTVPDISAFCMSQYAVCNVKEIGKRLGIAEERAVYIGNEYGYTGTSSPFIALNRAVESGLIKRGDYFILWTIGGGTENIGVLSQY